MTDKEFLEIGQRFLDRFQSTAEDAVRRDHYQYHSIPDFEEKVDAKMTSMVYYLIDEAGRNAV